MGDQIDQQYELIQIVVFAVCGFLFLAFLAFMIATYWKVFAKAGKPGWAAIIPIYNYIVLLEIIGRPIWWIFLFLVPLINIVITFIMHIDLARSFGKGTGFGVGLTLLSIIFFPILAFGDARYLGPAAGGSKRGVVEPN